MKDILVALTGKDADDVALSAAHDIGKPFSSHITAVHASLDAKGIQHVAIKLGSAGILEDYLKHLQKAEVESTHKAKAAFDRMCAVYHVTYAKDAGSTGMTASWKELSGDPLLSLIPEARFHDLTVVAREDGYDCADLGGILLGSGRPLLLIPPSQPAVALDTVVVAWKDTREAAHAVTAAMPILAKARRVIVAAVNEDEATGQEHGARATAQLLRWHGIEAEATTVDPGHEKAVDALFHIAREHEAGLLVMGGYGHSRLREIVFGGFTRQVLTRAPMPVFLCH